MGRRSPTSAPSPAPSADATSAAAKGARVRISRPKTAEAMIANERTIGAGSISTFITLSLRYWGPCDPTSRNECLARIHGNSLTR